MTRDEAEQLVASVPRWHHTFEVFPGVMTPGAYNPSFMWQMMRETADWSGARVLDIGPADGAFSKWAADAGAQVTALDYRPKHVSGFQVMEQLSGHSLDFRNGNVLDAADMGLGEFDVVLFLGVLYHLPDPLRGLYACRKLCRTGGILFVETWFDPELSPDVPAARYLPNGAHADYTNFWVPNRLALLAMLQDFGFEVMRESRHGGRMFVHGRAIEDPTISRRMSICYPSRLERRP